VPLGDFLIDKFEVSNRLFKQFLEAGGYQNTNAWIFPVIKDGRMLSWEEAMSQFRDQTGKPGPSTWTNGSHPAGQADYPVTGVSWYEAAAYARFAGKELPTIFHWNRAAHPDDKGQYGQYIQESTVILRLSNFDKRGPAPVGKYQGLSPWGAYDMAGNAREWCWNESDKGTRCMLGGAWSDPDYMFYNLDESDPLDRSSTRGFRCMKRLTAAFPTAALSPIQSERHRDYAKEKPVSAEVFQAYKRLFDYEKTPPDPVVETVQDGSDLWKKERITFRAPDSNERIPAYLFLPKTAAAPYQTIVFFPHADAFQPGSRQTNLVAMDHVTPLVGLGRAVLYPVYIGSYERYTNSGPTAARTREYRIQMTKEFRRSIDYLETRPDIDHHRIGFVGVSRGAIFGPMLLALDDRVRTGVLDLGGLPLQSDPEVVDLVNFVPRVTVPILMLNGRYDPILPLETSQLPLFHLLGTPPDDKRHILYDRGHEPPPPSELKAQLSRWLDKYLGPAK
jgi:dienelactone hydrolase